MEMKKRKYDYGNNLNSNNIDFQNLSGQSNCKTCSGGYIPDSTRSKCNACAAGTYAVSTQWTGLFYQRMITA